MAAAAFCRLTSSFCSSPISAVTCCHEDGARQRRGPSAASATSTRFDSAAQLVARRSWRRG
eukprot:2725370-Prymnesium_polylepis.1